LEGWGKGADGAALAKAGGRGEYQYFTFGVGQEMGMGPVQRKKRGGGENSIRRGNTPWGEERTILWFSVLTKTVRCTLRGNQTQFGTWGIW